MDQKRKFRQTKKRHRTPLLLRFSSGNSAHDRMTLPNVARRHVTDIREA